MIRILKTIEIKSTPERVFQYVDDEKHVGSHLTYSSDNIMGMKFDTSATTLDRIENKKKTYRFRAGPFVFDIRLIVNKTNTGTDLTIIVDYQPPYSILGKILDWFFIRKYLQREVDRTFEVCQKILERESLVRK